MDPSIIVSLAGLALTASSASYAFKLQPLEGTKLCDNQTIRVLHKEDKLYVRTDKHMLVMSRVPTAKGVVNIRRFETSDRKIAYLQLPEKAMILNNDTMRPVTNDCLNI